MTCPECAVLSARVVALEQALRGYDRIADEFIEKVESGRARSVATYAALVAAREVSAAAVGEGTSPPADDTREQIETAVWIAAIDAKPIEERVEWVKTIMRRFDECWTARVAGEGSSPQGETRDA